MKIDSSNENNNGIVITVYGTKVISNWNNKWDSRSNYRKMTGYAGTVLMAAIAARIDLQMKTSN